MASLRARLGGDPAWASAIVALAFGALAASNALSACISVADSDAPELLPDPAAATLVVPSRTALVIACSDGAVAATGNATASRAALSTAKLYLAEHVLSRAGLAEEDRALVGRMIARSDDHAADILDGRHPSAIDSVADRYGLQETVRIDRWGTSRTSAADLVAFLQRARETRAGREVLALMATTELIAADGERQDWGVARIPGMEGVKLGWSDWGEPTVASVGFGDGFIVAGSTIGSREQHTADIAGATEGSCVDALG
ncbi:hypothetical protein HT102_13895 [Hoyosella sp. G463]|uniref:Serine hydrolase n=1 Tax=Lolliginicoccus lacisalsi TaxID=2742202 RepID=A0A927PLV7_9ACTN|nr:hypothetical protein [Lolliginicoccus lacisalsi]MBD8507575.1 hypothetical protein [Lolliginicoccus lacisalsi]